MKQLIKRFLKEQVDTKKVKVQTSSKDGKILIIDADTHDVYRYELIATGKFLGTDGSIVLSATSIDISSGSITIKLPKKDEEDKEEVINEIIPQNIISDILSTYNKDENPKSFINIMDIEYGKAKINYKISLKFIDKIRATPRTNESYSRFLKEETSRQTKVISMINNLGLVSASKMVGGFLNLVKILNIDVENIDEQEKLIKSYIYFADVEDIEVDFIEVKNIYNRKLIKIYFGTDSSASNIESWYSRTITDEMNNFFPFKVDVVWHPVNYPHAKIMIDATHGGSVDFPNEINESIKRTLKEDTNSKLYKSIYNYIENHPYTQNLKEFDGGFMDWDEDEWVDVIDFGQEQYDPVFEYYPENKYIIINNIFGEQLEQIFGKRFHKPFIDWFTKTYGYEVSEIF